MSENWKFSHTKRTFSMMANKCLGSAYGNLGFWDEVREHLSIQSQKGFQLFFLSYPFLYILVWAVGRCRSEENCYLLITSSSLLSPTYFFHPFVRVPHLLVCLRNRPELWDGVCTTTGSSDVWPLLILGFSLNLEHSTHLYLHTCYSLMFPQSLCPAR